MRILQVFNQYRFRGGEEAWVDGIADLLGDTAVVDELRFSSNDWIGEGAPSLLRQISLMGNNPHSRAALRERVSQFKPDVLLFHNVIPVGSFGLFQEAKSLGIPVLCYTHNFRPFSPGGTLWTGSGVNDAALRGNPWPEILRGAWQGSRIKTAILAWHLYRARKKGLIDNVDRWIAISEFMRDKFCEAGIPKEKIKVIRHCWQTTETCSDQPEGNHYLFLGRLVAEKGVISLIEAWRILEDQLGISCPKLVIGGTGPEEERMRELATNLTTVKFAGFVSGEEKDLLLQQCRALLVPSIWWEPLGLTTFEAYAVGRPVIAARSGALQETVHDGESGWLHEAGNPEDLAHTIIDSEGAGEKERLRRGRVGKAWLKHEGDPSDWRRKFLAVFDEPNQADSIN